MMQALLRLRPGERFAICGGAVPGFTHSESCGEMLTHSRGDHVGVTCCYYDELALDETLRRHRTKALSAEATEADVASWHRCDDRVTDLRESVFDMDVSAADAIDRVLADAGYSAQADTGR